MTTGMYACFVFCMALYGRFWIVRHQIKPISEKACIGILDQVKFCQALWRAIIYGVTSALAVSCMIWDGSEWMHDSTLFWKGWPNHDVTQYTLFVYAAYLGIYVHHIIILCWDSVGGDFLALLLHHFIVLAIVFVSLVFHFTRVGIFTMALHDASDVFLEIARCFNYARRKHPQLSMGADVSFAVFAASFAYLRLYVFPTRVVYSVAFDACAHVLRPEQERLGRKFTPLECWQHPYSVFFLTLLCVLQGLQIFWGAKILRVLVKVVCGDQLDDPREED